LPGIQLRIVSWTTAFAVFGLVACQGAIEPAEKRRELGCVAGMLTGAALGAAIGARKGEEIGASLAAASGAFEGSRPTCDPAQEATAPAAAG
jgi:outer membrane lipoprotein SlyB